LLLYILFEKKYIHILALEMARPGNQHCANCIGTLSFPLNRDNNTLCEYARLLSQIPDNTTDAMIETAKLQLVTIKEFYNRLLKS